MGFISTRYFNYRNIQNCELNLNAPQVLLIGENGQGKTNFIESIYVICFGASFRTNNVQRMIKKNEEKSALKGIFSGKNELQREVLITMSRGGKKEIRVDKKIIRDRKELIENIPCIVFSHQDMDIITGLPEMRRRFFNQTLSLYDYLFIDLMRRYRKILKQRNILLKEKKYNLFPAFNQNLAHVGLQIQNKRSNIVEEFNNTFISLFQEISELHGEFNIIYRPSWKHGATEDEVVNYLESQQRKDLRFETTTSGPHRDNFIITKDGSVFAYIASTGQIRMVSLILKIAQSQFYSAKSGRAPILLLDDVMLELDARRRENFIRFLPQYEQAFFTFLPGEKFFGSRDDNSLVYSIKNGEFILTE